MSDIDKRLDEILAGTIFIDDDTKKWLIPSKEWVTKKSKTIKQLMADEFEKMIGEEKVNSVFDQDYIDGWNNHLYELRQKLKEWKK